MSVVERLIADASVHQRRLLLAGVSTAVLAGGDGPPVVLLHGQAVSQRCGCRSSPTW